MANLEDIIPAFGGGLDQDSDIMMLFNGKSRYRLNMVETNGDLGASVNIKGTSRIDGAFSLPSGTNRCIGKIDDGENGTIIAFIYNSNNYHSIVAYDPSNDNAYYILDGTSGSIGSILNFNEDYYIDAGIIGNGDERFLVWTDGYNKPRIINIVMAVNYTSGSGNPIYNAISSEIISLYKKPYIKDINVIGIIYDSSYGLNNIDRKIFQFAVRLVYYDKTLSSVSPFSRVIYPSDSISVGRVSDKEFGNYIFIELDFDNDTDLVDKYQLLYRNIDKGDSVTGSWYVYDEYDYSSVGTITHRFYNDKNLGVVSDEEAYRLYDYTPDKASKLFIIDSNRIVLGGVTEGFDPVSINAVAVSNEISIPSFDEGISYNNSGFISNGGTTNISFTSTESSGSDRYVYFQIVEIGGINETFTFPSSYKFTHDYWMVKLRDFINAISGIEATAVYSSPTLTVTMNVGSTKTYFLVMLVLIDNQTFTTLKTGAIYKYGIRYGYGGKVGPVQTNDDMILTTNNISSIASTYTNYRLTSSITINNIAPLGADNYQIVSFGSNIDYYEQYYVYGNFANIADSSSKYTIYTDGISTIIKRDDMVGRMLKAYNNSINYGGDFQKGDVIRLIGVSSTIPTSGTVSYDVDLFNDDYEYLIDSVTSTEIKISYSAIELLNSFYSGEIFIMIEILRYKDFSEIAQEYSDVFAIDSNGYHLSNQQDQTSGLPAIVNLTEYFADCFKTKQPFINNENFSDYGLTASGGGFYAWMEKPSISLYYPSTPSNLGRFLAVGENYYTNTIRKIKWGGKFIDNSNINFMTRFEFDDEKYLDDEDGEITRIQQIGNTLKVYQERGVTSFYLGATYATDPEGNETTAFSSQVMSEPRKSGTEYGCSYFTGYVRTPEIAYFFDVNIGAVLKDTNGGIFPINNYMNTYFRKKAKDILSSSDNISVHMGYDSENKWLFVSFVNHDNSLSPINETLLFKEDTQYWDTFCSFIPEMYGEASGAYMLSFKNGLCYTHNTNSLYNYFYDTIYPSIITLHCVVNPSLLKIFEAIELVGDTLFYCPNNGDISIEKPLVMSSRLKSGKFVRQEGVYRSDLLNDMNTTGSPSINSLFNGRKLRGYEISLRLYNIDASNGSKFEINAVKVLYAPSK